MTPRPQSDARPQDTQAGAATAQIAPGPGESAPSGGVTLSLVIRPGSARVGESLTVEITADSAVAVVDAPLHLVYDSSRLRFLEASEGDYLKRDGGSTVFLANGQSRPGDVIIGVGRTDRSRGATGRGTLCRVRFEALASGTARISIGPAMAWAVDGSLIPVATQAGEVNIP